MKYCMAMLILGSSLVSSAQNTDTRFFELRTYHCYENKRPDLIRRFQDHTIRLFEKHGIENIAYFIPMDSANYSLTFILAYPTAESRDELWNNFATDPEWVAAAKASEENGKLVKKVDQTFMKAVPELHPSLANSSSSEERIFQLRTYHCFPGKIPAINSRFRDHTMELFEKHGMTNIVYWNTVEKDGTQPKLVYLLAHPSEAAGKASFEAFRRDPVWQAAAKKSEENGKIVEKVDAVFMQPLPFSPLK